MLEYRAYILSADGHIINRIDLPCDNEHAARECARQLVDGGRPVELWRLGQLLERFEPKQ